LRNGLNKAKGPGNLGGSRALEPHWVTTMAGGTTVVPLAHGKRSASLTTCQGVPGVAGLSPGPWAQAQTEGRLCRRIP